MAALELDTLDTLVHAPSSVAALYGTLVWLRGHDRVSAIDALRAALEALEREGAVAGAVMTPDGHFEEVSDAARARCWQEYARWLPTADRGDLALDEVGLWYRVTDLGRQRWHSLESGSTNELWQVNDDRTAGRLEVDASSEKIGEQALERWLASHPDVAVHEKTVHAIAQVTLQSGQRIAPAVRISCHYRSREAGR